MQNKVKNINNYFSNHHCDFENNVKGVDTLCGTIASLNRIYSDPIIKRQILNKITFPWPYNKLNGILTITKQFLKINKPTQEHFIAYVEKFSNIITQYLKTLNFKYNFRPNINNDCIHYLTKTDKVGFLSGLGISYKNGKYYPYDTFLYELLVRTKTFKYSYNNVKRYEAKQCQKVLQNDKEFITIAELKRKINNLVKEYEENNNIITTIQILYDHKAGGHYTTFVRNKNGEMDFIRADKTHDDNEMVKVRSARITVYPAHKLETLAPITQRAQSAPLFIHKNRAIYNFHKTRRAIYNSIFSIKTLNNSFRKIFNKKY